MKDIFENEYLFDLDGREPELIQRRLKFFEDLGCVEQDKTNTDSVIFYSEELNSNFFHSLFKDVIKPNIDTYYIVNQMLFQICGKIMALKLTSIVKEMHRCIK